MDKKMKNTRGFIEKERPDLIEEWHTVENNENIPSSVRAGSDKVIVWCCKEKRKWNDFSST
jgi:hypothetical protein